MFRPSQLPKTPKMPKVLAAIAQSVIYRILMVTPAYAKEILKNNSRNYRKLNMRRVSSYATAMKNNEWELNHQSIAIDFNGVLLDGQHRLMAVVESGMTVPMSVCFNAPPGSVTSSDETLTRKNADHLYSMRRNRLKYNESQVAAILTCLNELSNGGNKVKLSKPKALVLFDRYESNINAICEVLTVNDVVATSAIKAALVFAHVSHPHEASSFAETLNSLKYKGGSPELALAQFLKSDVYKTNHRRRTMLRVLKCLLYSINGKRMLSIAEPDDNLLSIFGQSKSSSKKAA